MWTCKHVHDGAVVGTLVVVVLMPISLAMDNGEFNSDDGGGGGGSGSGQQRWRSMVVEGGGVQWRRQRLTVTTVGATNRQYQGNDGN